MLFITIKYELSKTALAWRGLQLFGQQLLVGVEDAGVGDDHRGADVHFLLSLRDTDT